jgi:transcriptional regulator with XRE-family HTH domain
MSQQEFCKLLGIGWDDLAAFEAGAKRVNASLLFRVAKSLDVRPDYFFRGTSKNNRRRFSSFFVPICA